MLSKTVKTFIAETMGLSAGRKYSPNRETNVAETWACLLDVNALQIVKQALQEKLALFAGRKCCANCQNNDAETMGLLAGLRMLSKLPNNCPGKNGRVCWT